MKRLGFLFDQTLCIGCNACQIACKDKHNLELGMFFRRAETMEYEIDGLVYVENYSGACNHCAEAACAANCPTGAMFYNEDGTVGHDESKCIACGTCVWACPYGAPKISHKKGIALKCTACSDLRLEGKNPACVDACITHCLKFCDLDEIDKAEGCLTSDMPFLPNATITRPSLLIKRRCGNER